MIIQNDYLNENVQLPGFGLFYDNPFMTFVREIYCEPPRPLSCYPYADNFSIRLQYHRRSVCYSPIYQEGRSASALCVKGLEPIIGDFERNIADLSNEGPTNSGQRLLEHFVWTENKLPGAVTLQEARLAADMANRLQKRFSGVHGELARLPLPVFVARHSQESEAKYLALLKRYSNTSTFLRIEEILGKGMGVYGYLYPTPPIRVRHLPIATVSNPIQSRLEVLQARGGGIPCIQAWVDLFCQLLQLGYLPTSTASRWTGSCCDAGNAVIDGGFADLESFVAIDDEGILSRIPEHLSFAISTLANTIISCAAGEHPSIKNSDLPKSLAYSFILEACRRNLSPTSFDARPEAKAQVFQFINAIHSPSDLLALLQNFFPDFERAKSVCSESKF
jgi:hypothetical protein